MSVLASCICDNIGHKVSLIDVISADLMCCFRDIVMDVLSMLLQHVWIMKSAENRCAYVRGEYVRILLLLLQWYNDHNMQRSEPEEKSDAIQTDTDVSAGDKFQFSSNTGGHLNCHDLRFLEETFDGEMRLLIDCDGSEMQRQTQVRM